MEAFVSTEVRDKTFHELLTIRENNFCFDCGSKKPKWASVYLGLFICFECSGRHRSYGTSISFVRSIDLDKWKLFQLEGMKLGGNLRAKERFKELNIEYEGKIINYQDPKIMKYKEEIAQEARDKLREELQINEVQNHFENKAKIEDVKFNDSKSNEDNIVKKDKLEEVEKVQESKVVDLTTESRLNRNIKKKKNQKIEKIDNFDFDWDDDFEKKPQVKAKKIENTDYDEFDIKQKEEKMKKKFEETNQDSSDDEKKGNLNKNQKYVEEIKNNTSTNNTVDTSKFNNRKAISSDDYANANVESNWKVKEKEGRLKQMKGATAISSAELNGEEAEEGKDQYYYLHIII